jgi:hypothetical protein
MTSKREPGETSLRVNIRDVNGYLLYFGRPNP